MRPPLPSPSLPQDSELAPELAVLEELVQVLEDEAKAIRDLDVVGIDAAAETKQSLDARLAELRAARGAGPVAPGDDVKTRYRVLVTQVRDLAERNVRRLQSTHRTIKELVSALTGAPVHPGYGRRGRVATPGSAVLTSTIG